MRHHRRVCSFAHPQKKLKVWELATNIRSMDMLTLNRKHAFVIIFDLGTFFFSFIYINASTITSVHPSAILHPTSCYTSINFSVSSILQRSYRRTYIYCWVTTTLNPNNKNDPCPICLTWPSVIWNKKDNQLTQCVER